MTDWMVVFIIAGAYMVAALGIQAYGYHRLTKLATAERRDLLDRIQAPTLKEYKVLSQPVVPTEPAEPKEKITQM